MDKKRWEYHVFLSKVFFLTVSKKLVGVTFVWYVSENFWQQKFSFYGKEGGISRVSVEKFLSDGAEKFRRETLQCVISFGNRKILCFRGLCNDFLSKNFCLTVPKHFVGEPFCAVFQRNSSGEKVYGKEGVGVTRFSVENFLSHSAEKISRRSLLCCVSEKFRQRKSLEKRRRGKYQQFLSKLFSSHGVEKCHRDFLQSFIYFGYGEKMDGKVRGESIKIFR